jgi:2-methylisocitrate lyase-like PEP mutase family enzyme
LNILAVPGTPTVDELHELGVARISVGSGAMRTALTAAERLARELLDHGTYGALDDAIAYPQLLRLFDRLPPR